MKYVIFLFCVLFMIGCSSSQQEEIMTDQPVLIEQYPLPTLPQSATQAPYALKMRLFLDEGGNVQQVKLLNGIGNETWDSLAVYSIKRWRYSPACFNGKPIKTWVNQQTLLKISEPVYLSLAEIQCYTPEKADTVFAYLKDGRDFCELASIYSCAATKDNKGVLGKIDINRYSVDITKELQSIRSNEFTRPLKFGQKYIIFKRME